MCPVLYGAVIRAESTNRKAIIAAINYVSRLYAMIRLCECGLHILSSIRARQRVSDEANNCAIDCKYTFGQVGV